MWPLWGSVPNRKPPWHIPLKDMSGQYLWDHEALSGEVLQEYASSLLT